MKLKIDPLCQIPTPEESELETFSDEDKEYIQKCFKKSGLVIGNPGEVAELILKMADAYSVSEIMITLHPFKSGSREKEIKQIMEAINDKQKNLI